MKRISVAIIMMQKLNKRLEKLQSLMDMIQPKVSELMSAKQKEIEYVEVKYSKLIQEISEPIQALQREVYNEFIDAFISLVLVEFDKKRTVDIYRVGVEYKQFLNLVEVLEWFPRPLVSMLREVAEDPVKMDEIVENLETIKSKYRK